MQQEEDVLFSWELLADLHRVGHLEDVVSRELAEQKVIQDLNSSKLVRRRRVMDVHGPDLNVVATLAWSDGGRCYGCVGAVGGAEGGQEKAGGVHDPEQEHAVGSVGLNHLKIKQFK